jgi:hypothetical protein
MSRPSPWPALLPIFPELPGTFLLLSCFNLVRSLVLIFSSWCRAARSLDPVAPGVTPAAPPTASSAAPPAASNASTTPVPSRKRAADAATSKAERAKKQKAAAEAKQARRNTPPPSSIDMAAPVAIATAEPLLIDPSGVAHSGVPIADVDDERHTPPVASPARVTVAIPAPAVRSADPAATATDQTAPDSVVPPPSSGVLVRQPLSGPLSRADWFRQAYSGAFDTSSARSSADPTASPSGSEDQTPAHLQHRLMRLASEIQDFAAAAAQQVASSEQSLLVSFLF